MLKMNGRYYRVTAHFRSDAEANAYMAQHPAESLIAIVGAERLIAQSRDEGIARLPVGTVENWVSES